MLDASDETPAVGESKPLRPGWPRAAIRCGSMALCQPALWCYVALIFVLGLANVRSQSAASAGVPTQSAPPKLELVRDKESFVLKYSLQNTQGIFSIFRADSLEQIRRRGQPVLTDPIPPVRQAATALGIGPGGKTGFFLLAEYPDVNVGDLEVPGPAEAETGPSGLGFVATRGVPVPLKSGQPFFCSFVLAGPNGLPLAVNGSARVVLLDAAGQAVTFAYSINPSSLSFTNGVAQATLTATTTQNLAGCTLALTANVSSPANSVPGQASPTTRKSLASLMLTLNDILGLTPVQTIPQAGPLDLNPADPSFGTKWAQALKDLRRTVGTASPAWRYPMDGGRRPISGNFGEWYRSGGRIHAGLDLADAAGTKVVAAERGLVTSVGPSGDNSYIVIDHGYGVWTLYQHVYATGPQCKVKVNDPVSKGQELTQILDYGPAGAKGDHLHFSIRRARNSGENQIQFGGQPGKAVNPARDLNFGDVAFALPKLAPMIKSVLLTPFPPDEEGFHNGDEKSSNFPKLGTRDSVYLLVQAMEQSGANLLAPYRVTWRPAGAVPSALEITFDDLDQAGKYIPEVSGGVPDRHCPVQRGESRQHERYPTAGKVPLLVRVEDLGLRFGPRRASRVYGPGR